MRWILLLILTLPLLQLESAEYKWNVIKDNSTNFVSANHIAFIDSNSYIVAKSKGLSLNNSRYIIKTEDYGMTWDTLFFEDIPMTTDFGDYAITDLVAIDDKHIFAAYGFNSYLKSTNGGKDWEDFRFQDTSFNFLRITQDNNLIFLGENRTGKYAFSNDFGKSWEVKHINFSIDSIDKYDNIMYDTPCRKNDTLYSLIYLQTKVPFMSYLSFITNSLLIYSTDDGHSWQQMIYVEELGIMRSMAMYDNKIITQVINNTFHPELVVSPDDGSLDTFWVSSAHNRIAAFDKTDGSCTFLTDSVDFKMGNVVDMQYYENGLLSMATETYTYVSKDYGVTWEKEETNDKKPISKVARPCINKGLMIGDNYYAILEPITSVFNNRSLLPETITLFPNPISKSNKLHIEFEVEIQGEYSFSLTSADGAKFDFNQKYFAVPGNNTISLDIPNEVAAGAYFLSITKDGEILAVKQLVVQ
jgi:photosystem II stability/assembly factor-like uncharacterized protein